MWQTDTIIHNWKWIIFFFKWCRLNGGNLKLSRYLRFMDDFSSTVLLGQCQLLYPVKSKTNTRTHTYLQIAHAKRFSRNLYKDCKENERTPTEPQQDILNFRFLQSVAIPIIFPPTLRLMSNEPYQYWKWTAIFHHLTELTVHSYCASAQVQSLCSAAIKLWPLPALMILCCCMEKYEKRIVPGKSLSNEFRSGLEIRFLDNSKNNKQDYRGESWRLFKLNIHEAKYHVVIELKFFWKREFSFSLNVIKESSHKSGNLEFYIL